MSPRWRVEEGRLVEDEGASVVDIILTVSEGKLDAVLDAIAELAQRLFGDDEPEP